MRLFTVKKLLLLTVAFLFLSAPLWADKKKKTSSQYQKPNIIKRAWGDLTTRNNYYFNANELYKEVVRTYQFQRTYDYNKLLPFYYHDEADFSNYTGEMETVAKKTGIVLQLHDYSRWRDNAFLLLGKSQFLRQQYDTSLITFQYIVTTMKPGKMNNKVEFSNRDRLKYLRKRQKEIEKKANAKKKFIDLQWKQQQDAAKEKAEDAREKQEAAIAKKKKELEEIIKAKKKIIELQKKGKKIPADLLAKAKSKTSSSKDSTDSKIILPDTKSSSKKPSQNTTQPYVLLGDKYVENPYYKDSTGNRDNQKPLDSLSKKQEAKFEKLSLWERMKHQPSRPEAIIWMAKSLIELENYPDAKSMLAYGKSLRKLTKKQRREFYLAESYYNIRRKDYSPAIEELENAMLLFKKKKQRAYYEYILAQLYMLNNQPADAVDYFVKAGKHTKTEELNLFAQIQLAKLYSENPDLADQDIVKMLTKLIRFGKNKDYADEVLYTIANYYYFRNDSGNAIAYLQKSIDKSTTNLVQKGKSFLKLGEIYYDKEMYGEAAVYYDSAIVYLPTTFEQYDKIKDRKDILNELAGYNKTIAQEDSLQRLGRMSPVELKKYLAEQQAIKEKAEKKKSRFSTEGGADSFQPVAFIPEDAVSNGLWYFYNPEAKSKGYNEFIRVWGDRKLEDNWRRSNKSDVFEDASFGQPAAQPGNAQTTDTKKTTEKNAVKPVADSLQIPKDSLDFIFSNEKIANALFGKGEIFKNKLNNLPKAKQAFDDLIRRFPNSNYDALAHYYEYLIFKEQQLNGLAQKEKDYILEKYPDSEVAAVLNGEGKPKVKVDPAAGSAQKLYANTYQLFNEGQYDQVIKNKYLAKSQYPGAAEIPQFEFLEAVSYGKLQQFDAYKKSLSDIVMKYRDGAIKQKAQEYLIAYIQFESSLKDSTAAIVQADTIAKPAVISEKLEFVTDTSDLFVIARLNDKYLKVGDIVANIQAFNKKFFDDQKIKINPYFIEGFGVIQMRRFEGITDALKYYRKISAESAMVMGKNSAAKVQFYVIAPANYKLIKKQADLDKYAVFFMENYMEQ